MVHINFGFTLKTIYWAETYVHTIKENAKALVAAGKETDLEVNAVKLRTGSRLEIRMQEKSQYRDW